MKILTVLLLVVYLFWEAYEDHLAVDHTRAYRAKLQPMLGSPFDERLQHVTSAAADR